MSILIKDIKDSQNKTPVKSLKETVISSKLSDNKVFSYSIKKANSNMVLHQLETGFSLSIKMEKIEEALRVTSFTIEHESPLSYVSAFLHDAAIIELAIKGITSLFAYADRYEMPEIFFLLPQEEAWSLDHFESYFDSHSSCMTIEGSRVSFILYNTPEVRQAFLEEIQSMKKQVKQGLWKAQKGDHYLKDYLHNHKQGEPLSFARQESQNANSNVGTIIPFPKAKK